MVVVVRPHTAVQLRRRDPLGDPPSTNYFDHDPTPQQTNGVRAFVRSSYMIDLAHGRSMTSRR